MERGPAWVEFVLIPVLFGIQDVLPAQSDFLHFHYDPCYPHLRDREPECKNSESVEYVGVGD